MPTQFVILGGSGDLSKRKLLPALLDLYAKKVLPETFRIVGVARTPRTDEEFRDYVKAAIKEYHHEHAHDDIDAFCAHIEYIPGSFDDSDLYARLQESLIEFNTKIGQCSNTLFYLAVPPAHYESIFTKIHNSGLSRPCDEVTGWTRILVEKPFGHDRESAQALDELLSSLYREEQIFRIDHYIAKEAIQNILSFRFANILLRDQWCARTVKEVHITMHETVDVGERGSFYDGIGALRDVGQNHLLQLLALITMKEPEAFTPEDIRTRRAELLETLIPMTPATISTQYQRGQYEGYRNTDGIDHVSETETAFKLTTYLDHPDWEGVPIYIETAKAAAEKKVEARVEFHDVATGMFETKSCFSIGNEIVMSIEPEQALHVTLNAKSPGHGFQLESRTLSFTCAKDSGEVKNAYERVLMDSITGDQTLFISSREVLAQWSFINSILNNQAAVPLDTYQHGTDTPFKKHDHE